MLYERVIKDFTKSDFPLIRHFSSNTILILKPDFYINLEVKLNDFYQFAISTQTGAPAIIIDGKTFHVPPYYVVAINPGQEVQSCINRNNIHGICKCEEYYALFVKKELFDNLSVEFRKKERMLFDNKIVFPGSNFMELISSFITECSSKQPGYEFMLDTISIQIAVELIRNIPNNLFELVHNEECCLSKDIKKAVAFMREHIDENISVQTLCKIAHLSPYHFIRMFKKYTGRTPHQYFIDIKLNKAIEFLNDKKLSITEVAFLSGFSSQSYFSAMFKKKFGYSPLEYKKNIAGSQKNLKKKV